ncbi:MAG: MFS transporter [Kiloniellales bacterium]
MRSVLASVGSLLLGTAILMLGNSLLGIVLPLKMEAAAYSTLLTGSVMASYFAGLVAGSLYGKRFIAEVGHIRAFAGFAALTATVALLHPMVFNALAWGILRFVSGFCIAGLFAAMESWLNERSTNETRGRVLSIYILVTYLAIMLGQLSVNLFDLDAVEGFMMAGLLISLSLVPVVLTRIEAPSLEKVEPLSFLALYRSSPLGVIGCIGSGLLMGAYWGLGAVFATEVGFPVIQVSLFVSAVVAGGLIFQWPIGRLSDRVDRRKVMRGVLLAAALVCFGGIFALQQGAGFPAILLVGVLIGGTTSGIYPISTAQAYDYLPRSRYIGASAGLLLSYAIGAAAGPILCSLLMTAIGPAGFFWYLGVVAAGLAGFVQYRIGVRAPKPESEQEPVVVLPRMSPVAAGLDPRALPSAPASAERESADPAAR